MIVTVLLQCEGDSVGRGYINGQINHPPSVELVILSDFSALFRGTVPGGQIDFRIFFLDEDNDLVTFEWTDDCGGMLNPSTGGETLTWTAPSTLQPLSCTITATLRDDHGGSEVFTAPPIMVNP